MSGHLFFDMGVPEWAFELGGLDSLVFQIEGEAAPFCEWAESDCRTLAWAR